MSFLISLRKSGYRMPVLRKITGIFILTLIMAFLSGITARAEENGDFKRDVVKAEIANRHGTEMGSVDGNGNVLNISGILMGSADKEGNIINANGIDVGKVTKEGYVLNQSETKLGSVNSTGEIFNVSGGKMGEVKGESDLNRIGAAARLIILK